MATTYTAQIRTTFGGQRRLFFQAHSLTDAYNYLQMQNDYVGLIEIEEATPPKKLAIYTQTKEWLGNRHVGDTEFEYGQWEEDDED